MNKQKVSIILLIIFFIGIGLTIANSFINNTNSVETHPGTLTIGNKTVNYDTAGKCVEVIDGNTIQVYGIGRVQLTQVKIPQDSGTKSYDAKKFVEDKCLGKTVYLDIDDKQKKDKYERTLAIVYTNTSDINKELIDSGLGEISYFEPSEFGKGEI